MKLKLTLAVLILLNSFFVSAKDGIPALLQNELKHHWSALQRQELKPYFMSFRVIERNGNSMGSSFGAMMNSESFSTREFTPHIRIGSAEFDNFRYSPMSTHNGQAAYLPVEKGEKGMKEAIWQETNNRYKFAITAFQQAQAKKDVNVSMEDKAPQFSESKVEKYYEKPLTLSNNWMDTVVWKKRLNEISSLFRGDAKMFRGYATLTTLVERRYYVDSEGRNIVQNLPYVRLMVSGMTRAEDGMELPLMLSFFAFSPDELPAQEEILKQTKQLVAKLQELREAPMVDPFTGPAILSGAASGVFFHEIFGHRIEGLRMKSESDGQTFKKMVGQFVLPSDMQVYDDPSIDFYNGEALNGYYKFDDQGIRGERVDVVVDGKLHDFLMTRTPIDGHPRSNGHARAERGWDAVSRQSNLVIESKNMKSDEELRTLLLAEMKSQGKDRGYFFKEVTGGFTFTGKGGTNSFNVTPLEVYEIYADGRPDKLVRGVDLIGTPLSMFSNIIYAGGKSQVFTGMCGAESGSIPVTAISPSILVKKVEMQRKAKSNNIAPILPPPAI